MENEIELKPAPLLQRILFSAGPFFLGVGLFLLFQDLRMFYIPFFVPGIMGTFFPKRMVGFMTRPSWLRIHPKIDSLYTAKRIVRVSKIFGVASLIIGISASAWIVAMPL